MPQDTDTSDPFARYIKKKPKPKKKPEESPDYWDEPAVIQMPTPAQQDKNRVAQIRSRLRNMIGNELARAGLKPSETREVMGDLSYYAQQVIDSLASVGDDDY